MSRNKTLAALQKTYDDSYLSCSTAVYHESQVSTRRYRSMPLPLVGSCPFSPQSRRPFPALRLVASYGANIASVAHIGE